MKRIFLLGPSFFLLLGLSLNAQPPCQGDTLLYEDFANGFNGNNSLGLSWDTSGTYQAWRACPSNCISNGPYAGEIGPLNSSTASNGYVNLDLQDAAGYTYSSSGPPPEQHLKIGPMDLSGVSGPVLRFETLFNHCCASDHELQVQVSTNGGTSWDDTLSVLPHISRNSNTDNPAKVIIPLSNAIASNPANVTLRFTWPPTLAGNGQVSGLYNWYIDDVLIGAKNLNDLRAGETTYKMDSSQFIPSQFDGHMEYTMIPRCEANCLRFGGQVCNIGRDSMGQVKLRTRVFDVSSGAQVFQSSSSPHTLAPNSCIGGVVTPFQPPVPDTVWSGACFSSTDTGLYEVEYKAYSDDTADCAPADNYGDKERFIVSQNTLAWDEYDITGQMRDPFVSPDSNSATSYSEVTVYNALSVDWFDGNNDTIDSISFYLHDTTQVGAQIVAGISVNVAQNVVFGLTDPFFPTASDIGGWVELPITRDGSGNSLPKGLPVSHLTQGMGSDSVKSVFVSYGGGSQRVGFGASGINPGPGTFVEGDFGEPGHGVYPTSKIPMVRVKMNCGNVFSSIRNERNGKEFLSLYPVPARDRVRIVHKGDGIERSRFSIYSSKGRKVLGPVTFSEKQRSLDVSKLESGIYFVKIEWRTGSERHREALKKLVVR